MKSEEKHFSTKYHRLKRVWEHLGRIWEAPEGIWAASGSHLGGIWDLPRGSWKQSWGSEAPDASERQKVAYLSAKNAKLLLMLQFHEGVLRVGVTKYCKLQ